MARLRLLPGEKELVRLRPTPGAWLWRYLLAVLWVAWGILLFTPIGIGLPEEPLPLRLAFRVAVPALPIVVGALLYATRGLWVRFGLACAGGLAVLPALVVGADLGPALGMTAFGLAGLVAFLLTEIDRRMRTIHLSNLRMLHNGGLWSRAGWTAHYDAILDVDARQSPIGRLLGYGTLEPVLARSKAVAPPTKRRKIAVPSMSEIDLSAPVRLDGVGPFRRVQHLVATFIQDATATPFLKAEQDTARRVSDAIRALGGANVLRR